MPVRHCNASVEKSRARRRDEGEGRGGGGLINFLSEHHEQCTTARRRVPPNEFAARNDFCHTLRMTNPLRPSPPPFPHCVSPSFGLFTLLPVFLVLHTFIATSGVTWDWRHFFFFFLAEKPLHVSRTLSKQLRGRFALISLERMLRTWKVFRRCLSRKIQQIINSRWRGMRDARSKIAINFWRIWRMKI